MDLYFERSRWGGTQLFSPTFVTDVGWLNPSPRSCAIALVPPQHMSATDRRPFSVSRAALTDVATRALTTPVAKVVARKACLPPRISIWVQGLIQIATCDQNQISGARRASRDDASVDRAGRRHPFHLERKWVKRWRK